jgi:hypothetical protein
MTIQRHFDFIIAIVDEQETSSPPLTDAAVYITGLELLDDVSTVGSYSDDEDSTIVSVESDSYVQIPLATTSQKQRPVSLSRPSRLEDDDQDSIVLAKSRVRVLQRNQAPDKDSLRITLNRLSATPAVRNHRDDEYATRDPFYDFEFIVPLSPVEGDE